MPTAPEAAILRALAWNAAIGYAPLQAELRQDFDVGSERQAVSEGEVEQLLASYVSDGRVICKDGRFALSEQGFLFAERAKRDRSFPRKWEWIKRLAGWLRWLPGVRFLAVCNTTALGAARDEADIDLFVIVRRGSLWLTRGIVTFFASLVRRRPGQRHGERDAWCFSFFMDDTDLSLERFAQSPDDPYLRFWTRHLLVVLDDGVGESFWFAQNWIWQRHPQAVRWISWGTLPDRSKSWPKILSTFDRWLWRLQCHFGSPVLRQVAAKQTTDVIMNEHVCKTHLDDRRTHFRKIYEAHCKCLGIAP